MSMIAIRKINMPRCHWNKQRGKHIHAKRAFETLQAANEYISKRNLSVQGYEAYQCSVCGKFHIGHKYHNN